MLSLANRRLVAYRTFFCVVTYQSPEQAYHCFSLVIVHGFRSLVKVESTYWGVVKLFNTENKLMFTNQTLAKYCSAFYTSNLVSYMLIKSRHFMWAYHILLYKISHTSCILFFFWFPCVGNRESAPSVYLR